MTAKSGPAAGDLKVFLRPGEFFFGDHDHQVRTILGSCVAVTMWHKTLRIGGMCHYMLPTPKRRNTGELDGRYAEDAVALFLRAIQKRRTQPRDYQVKVFGGGNMFPNVVRGESENIGARNVRIGLELLKANGFRVFATHLGGEGYRRLLFDIGNGDVWVYHNAREAGE